MDIIISSTSAPNYILNRHKISNAIQKRKNRSLFMIDLAVPRNINPDVTGFENVYLYDIVPDLREIAENYLKQRLANTQHCRKNYKGKSR